MTGLVVRTGLSVRLVRTSIEATVLVVGWLLGGSVGAGTVVYAFGIGPLVQFFVRITPKRWLEVSGWAAVAEASELVDDGSCKRGIDTTRVEEMVGERAGEANGAGPIAETRGHDLKGSGCQR